MLIRSMYSMYNTQPFCHKLHDIRQLGCAQQVLEVCPLSSMLSVVDISTTDKHQMLVHKYSLWAESWFVLCGTELPKFNLVSELYANAE